MGRLHPIALRVGNLINWSQDVRHPPLQRLVKFLFRERIASKPMIKATVNSIWVDITIYENHMKSEDFKNQFTFKLDLKKLSKMAESLGPIEERTEKLLKEDKYYSKLEKLDLGEEDEKKKLGRKLQAYIFQNVEEIDNLKLLNIHYDRPIYLRITPIKSPYINAQVTANYIANKLNSRGWSRPRGCLNDVKEFAKLNIENLDDHK